MTAVFCDRCGSPTDDNDHSACASARALEPPRHCPQCRRRLIVQVTPSGWTARCTLHGNLDG